MNRKILFLYLIPILFGTIAILLSCLLLTSSTPYFNWMIGLSSAIIIVGLSFLLNYLTEYWKSDDRNPVKQFPDHQIKYAKERAGYVVCKIMNVLLCIHLLILNAMEVEPLVLLLSICLVVVQYFLELIILTYYRNK